MCGWSWWSRAELSTRADVTVSLRLETGCMNADFVTQAHEGTKSRRAQRAPELGDTTRLVLGVVGIVLHSTYVGMHYGFSVMLMPPWAAYVLWGLWVLFLVLAVYLLRRRSAWALAVPFAAYGLWMAAGLLGESLLGWTA